MAEEEEQSFQTLEAIEARLGAMVEEIGRLAVRWAGALASLDQRLPRVRERIEGASMGLPGMLAAAAALVAAGVGAALLVSWTTRGWRRWLTTLQGGGYWGKVVRSTAWR